MVANRIFGQLVLLGGLLIAIAGCTTGQPNELVKPGPIDADAPKEMTRTSTGLKYRILRKSDGPKPKITDSVTVHYRGTLKNGKVFDSSYASGETVNFPLRKVIRGWTEGMQLVGEGGMIELEIPPQLGYGNQRSGSIPPNSTLYFIVELIEIGAEKIESKIDGL